MLHLISYGLGDLFDPAKFMPVRTHYVKPTGGLWASPVDASYGWRDWCEQESFGDLSTSFRVWFTGNILVIDCYEDLRKLPWQETVGRSIPDYEQIAQSGVDAIHLTERGQWATRLSAPSLYGWDCECVLIINPAGIRPEEDEQ